MRERSRKRNISGILVLLLFAGFAVCILAVLLMGADLYKTMTGRDQASYDRRTAAQYITTKVRQNDRDGMVFVGDFEKALPSDEGNTLFLTERIDGQTYCTRLYCCDGYIRELFSLPGEIFFVGDGEDILPAQNLWFSMRDGVVTAALEHPGGEREQFVLMLRSGEGQYEK